MKLDEWKNSYDFLSQALQATAKPQVRAVTFPFTIDTAHKNNAINPDCSPLILEKNITKKEFFKSTKLISFECSSIILLPGYGVFKSGWAASRANNLLGAVYQNGNILLGFVSRKYKKFLDINVAQHRSMVSKVDSIFFPTVWVGD